MNLQKVVASYRMFQIVNLLRTLFQFTSLNVEVDFLVFQRVVIKQILFQLGSRVPFP